MSGKDFKRQTADVRAVAPRGAGGSASGEIASSAEENDPYGASFDSMLESFSGLSGGEMAESHSAQRISVPVIGWVRSPLRLPEDGSTWTGSAPEAVLEILPDFVPGLDDLKPGLTVTVFTGMTLEERNNLYLRKTTGCFFETGGKGVFAACGAHGSNPVEIHQTVVREIEKQSAAALVRVDSLLAPDGVPILDIQYKAPAGQGLDEDLTVCKKNLIDLCARAHQQGLMDGFSGNASLRRGGLCVITGAGSAKGALGVTDFAVLDLESGKLLSGGQPSRETAMHLRIYRAQPEAGIILHTHPPRLTALSLRMPGLPMRERLKIPVVECAGGRLLCAEVGVFPFGSEELARAVAFEATKQRAVWMEGHGLCVWGAEAAEVLGVSEELEHLARVRILSGFEA
jgi:L-fuculose-phosphate aldolase